MKRDFKSYQTKNKREKLEVNHPKRQQRSQVVSAYDDLKHEAFENNR